jgi:hypothetical protein
VAEAVPELIDPEAELTRCAACKERLPCVCPAGARTRALAHELRAKGLRIGGVSHVIVPTPMDAIGKTLGAFADTLEKRRG